MPLTLKMYMLFAVASSPGVLFANLISLTANHVGSYIPGPAYTYTETVTEPALKGETPRIATINETTTVPPGIQPCYLGGGCPAGTFADLQFPQIVIPAGYYAVSATLQLSYYFPISIGAPGNMIGVSPILSDQPFLASSAGSSFRIALMSFAVANRHLSDLRDLFSAPPNAGLSVDYTDAVSNALLGNGVLAPISGNWIIEYGFKTGQSVFPGYNSVTTFRGTLIPQPDGYLNGTLTIDVEPVPEPGSLNLFLTAFAMAFAGIAFCGIPPLSSTAKFR